MSGAQRPREAPDIPGGLIVTGCARGARAQAAEQLGLADNELAGVLREVQPRSTALSNKKMPDYAVRVRHRFGELVPARAGRERRVQQRLREPARAGLKIIGETTDTSCR